MKLKNFSSKSGQLYCLPKVYNTLIKAVFRSIPSTLGTFNYDLAKALVKLLSEVCNSECTIKDSFSLASFIDNLRNDNYCNANFDIVSFNNIRIDDTVRFVLKNSLTGAETYKRFTRAQFKKI